MNPSPLLVIDYISAPNIQGYQNGTLILGTIHILQSIYDRSTRGSCCCFFMCNASDLSPRHTVDTTLPAVAVRL